MEKFYFVVTDPQAGWDCVRGIYLANDEDDVLTSLWYDYNDTEPTEEDYGNLLNDFVIHRSSFREI